MPPRRKATAVPCACGHATRDLPRLLALRGRSTLTRASWGRRPAASASGLALAGDERLARRLAAPDVHPQVRWGAIEALAGAADDALLDMSLALFAAPTEKAGPFAAPPPLRTAAVKVLLASGRADTGARVLALLTDKALAIKAGATKEEVFEALETASWPAAAKLKIGGRAWVVKAESPATAAVIVSIVPPTAAAMRRLNAANPTGTRDVMARPIIASASTGRYSHPRAGSAFVSSSIDTFSP